MPPRSVRKRRRALVCAAAQLHARLICALVAMLLSVGGNLASAAAPSWASECAATDDDAARLACYDAHNPPRKSAAREQKPAATTPAASTAPAAPSAAPAPAVPRTLSNKDFGLAEQREQESARAAKAAEPAELVARVDSVSEKLTGELLLKLDNGQSWIQAQRKAGVHIKAGERVTISRGALGGYLLSSDSGATMRVRRLQ